MANHPSVYCIGRNYVDHAKELGNAVPTVPVVFLKPAAALVAQPIEVALDFEVGRIDHEVEIVVRLGERGGKLVPEAYTVGIDFTARELQEELKKKSLPWDRAKGRKNFAPIGEWVRADQIKDPKLLALQLEIDGKVVQAGSSDQMLFSVNTLCEFLDREFPLCSGDLIFTGTPAGVGPVLPGNKIRAQLSCAGMQLAELGFDLKAFK